MELLSKHEHDEGLNNNIPLVTHIEYARGEGGMFTQLPPPIIAIDVESLNGDEGNRLYDSKSMDDENHNNNSLSTVHSDTNQPNNDENYMRLLRKVKKMPG